MATLALRCATNEARQLSVVESDQYKLSTPCDVRSIELSWHDDTRQRDVPARVYLPLCSGKHPVVVFSHGMANGRSGYAYLGKTWATHGYAVVHLQHHGTDDELLRTRGPLAIYRAAHDPKQWLLRSQDVRFAIDQLTRANTHAANAEEAPLVGALDLDHLAVAGHSYGAFTALSVSGMQVDEGNVKGLTADFRDPRVKVALALSTPKFDKGTQRAYATVAVPVLHMTGTRDRSRLYRTSVSDHLKPFELIEGVPQYLIVLEDLGHSSFSDDERHPSVNRELHRELIEEITTAFLDAYLLDNANAKQWLAEELPKHLDGAGAVKRKLT